MIRALHVVAKMPASGTERQLAGVLRAASDLWEPTLCVLNSGYRLTAELREEGIPTIELVQRHRRDARRLWDLRRLIRSGRFDLIHSSLWRANALVRALALGPRRPAIVISERAVEDFRPAHHRLIDGLLRPMTDGYVGNSDAVADFIVRAHRVDRSRVTVVGNGIDADVFHPSPSRKREEVVRIGWVGRLTHQKGIDVLLGALPDVCAKVDVPLEVLLAGTGEDRDELERQARGLPVRFEGFLDTPTDVAEFLRSLDLFVMPSRWEGLPNAVLEALACGVRVVATDVPGMRDAVSAGTHLVPPDDPAALAAAIVDAIANPGPPPSVSVPSFADIAGRHLQAFESAISRRQR